MQIGDTTYCDYQAATPIDPRVLEVIQNAHKSLFANPHSADHVLGWSAASAIDHAAGQIAETFGMSGEDLVFTSGASESNTMALNAIEARARGNGREKLLIGAGDHPSIYDAAAKLRLRVEHVPIGASGAPDPAWLEDNIDSKVAGVSLIAVNNENGAITDIEAISKICAHHDVPLHLDMSQAPVAIKIDLGENDIAYATLSSHKLYGPKGVGAFLCAPHAARSLQPIVIGGGQQNGRRGGTLPTELCLGFAEAIQLITAEFEADLERISQLRDAFVEEVERLNLGALIGQRQPRHPGNALIHFPGYEAKDLLLRLQPTVAASAQSACSSGSEEPSRVVQAMGISRTIAEETVRFSFGRFSDEAQIRRCIAALKQALSEADSVATF